MRSLAFVLVSGLLLTGCSAGSEAAAPSATPARKPPPAPSPATSPPIPGTTAIPTEPIRLTKKMTKPGTHLRFGEKAIVPVRHYSPLHKIYNEGVLGIVVEPIRTTPGSEVQGNFDEDSRDVLKRHTAYHARIIVTNESGNEFSPGTPRFTGDFGEWGPTVTLTGDARLPGCREGYPPGSKEFGHKGAVWKTCILAVSSDSRPMLNVGYADPPYGKEFQYPKNPAPDFNEHYELGAITWS